MLDSLVQALSQYDEAMEQAAAGRQAHVGAGADLEAVVQEIQRVVKVMDGLNRFRFANIKQGATTGGAKREIPALNPDGHSAGVSFQPKAGGVLTVFR